MPTISDVRDPSFVSRASAAGDRGLPRPLLFRFWAAIGRAETLRTLDQDPVGAGPARGLPLPDPRLTPGGLARPIAVPSADLGTLTESRTVAVVDDDPMMLAVLGHILEQEPYHLIVAGSGPEALAAIQAHAQPVHLLVTDYAMPGMEGRELARRVRQVHPAVRVLYETGFTDLLFDEGLHLEEGEAFVEKPFTARGLREAARMILFGCLNPRSGIA